MPLGAACAALLMVASPALAGPVSADFTLSATPTVVIPAVSVRIAWRIVNLSNANAYCTDDGTTPTATHATFIVFAGAPTDSSGTPPSAAAIQCIGLGAVTGEYW